MRVLLRVLLSVSLISIAGSTSSAQDSSAADGADEQARAYFKVEAFELAAAEFIRAFELGNNPSYLFNAALAYERAGMGEKAVELYDRYLALVTEGDKAVEARARKVAVEKNLLDKARLAQEDAAAKALAATISKLAATAREHQKAGRFAEAEKAFAEAYQLSQDPEFLFDGADALRVSGKAAEAMDGYRHYLRTAPQGVRRRTAERRLEELEESRQSASSPSSGMALPTESAEPAGDLGAGTEARSSGSSGRKKWGIGLVATGALGMTTGGVFGFIAMGQRDDALDPSIGACDDEFSVCNARGAALFEDAKTSAMIANVGVGLGLAVSVVGAYLWLSDDGTERASSSGSAAVRVSPTATIHSLGLAIEGGF